MRHASMSEVNSLLGNVPMPEGLSVIPLGTVADLGEMAQVVWNNARPGTTVLHGCAFRQGNRLQFSGAVSLEDYQRIVVVDQAQPYSTLEAAGMHANRPVVHSHLTKTVKYLKTTAAVGEPFILASFTLNYGADFWGARPDAEQKTSNFGEGDRSAILYVVSIPGALVSPAVLVLGGHATLVVSDGAHRTTAINVLAGKIGRDKNGGEIRYKGKLTDPNTLLANAVPILIVFDDEPERVKQDFADCASTSPIKPAMRAAFDSRSAHSRAVQELIRAVPVLQKAVEATASGMSPARSSPRIYTTAALRSFFNRAEEHIEALAKVDHPDIFPQKVAGEPVKRQRRDEAELMWAKINDLMTPYYDTLRSPQYASTFWTLLLEHLPPLKAIKPHYEATDEAKTGARPIDLREQYDGLGSIWLKPSGLSVLARLYAECLYRNLNTVKMVKLFAKLPDNPETKERGGLWSPLVRIRVGDTDEKQRKSVVGTQAIVGDIWQKQLAALIA